MPINPLQPLTPEEMQAQQDPALAPVAPPVEAPQVPTDADRIHDATVAGNKQQFYADLLRSFQSILQGAAPNSGFKADYSLADSMSKRAGQPLETVKTQMAAEAARRKEAKENEQFEMTKETHKAGLEEHKAKMDDFQQKLAASKLDFQDMQANSDPNSPQSKIAQDRVLEVQKKMGQPVNEAQIRSVSGKDLYNTFKYLHDDLTNFYKNENDRLDRASREKIAAEENASRSADRKAAAQEKADAAKEKRAEIGSEGQKAVDKDYAKHYNEFTSTGITNATTAIEKLDALATEMEKDQGMLESGGGRVASVLPDVVRSRDAIRRRDASRNLANRTLKALFGAQLSDAEREAAAKEYYNDALGNKENAEILRSKIKDLQIGLAQEQAKAKFYEANGSLKGFTGTQVQADRQPQNEAPYGDTTERNGKKYKWNATVGKYQLLGQ